MDSFPKMLKTKEHALYDKKKIAPEFNNFFTMVGPNLASKIPAVDVNFKDYFSTTNKQLMNEELCFEEFKLAFESLKRNKTSGADGINCNIILDVFDQMKGPCF